MIAIKDFEMPKDCDSCPFYTYYNDAEDDCRITGEGLYNVKTGERHEKCPLVVLEHVSEKTGHLELNDNCVFNKCSVCGYEIHSKIKNFCPNCGIKLIEPQEGEI